MTDSQGLPKVALIAGPTASGKSALALALAGTLPATIINADASQVYRDLRIVTARPTAADEAQAPHDLFGYIDGAIACTAARWAADARVAMGASIAAGRLPILVGGSGLYITTLLDGIAPVPEIDPAIRNAVRAMTVAQAFASLATEDNGAAMRLSPADTTRVARALEVVRSTGRTLKSWQSERTGGIADKITLVPIILAPPREALLERCDERLSMMLAHGGLDEVARLVARKLDPNLPVMRAIGVREIQAILAERTQYEDQKAAAQLATRQFAKRQTTWFRNQLPRQWFRYQSLLNDDNIDEIAILLRNILLTR